MDFFEILKKRRACHHFIPNKEISDEQLKELIQHTSLTPSGYNAQPWDFVIIRDLKNKKELQPIAFKQDHVLDASAIIVVVGDLNIGRNADKLLKDWVKYGYCTEEQVPVYKNTFCKPRKYERKLTMALRNSTLAAMTLIYAAENMGFATCPMMGLSQWELKEYLNIPEDRIITMMVAIGYEDKGKEKKQLPRKAIADMIHWEKWGQNN